ncbi:MAG: YraN family protein [Calditrichaeota bacterium]|nr:YraN family protein [Calditrichota bacterium]
MPKNKKAFGRWGEEIAARFLLERGMTILERNFRAERGEMDLIAQDGNVVVFVEVKTGDSHRFGLPEERITRSKQRQLYKIAQAYIQLHPRDDVDYRFDVVIVDGNPRDYRIRYYPNAFYLWST